MSDCLSCRPCCPVTAKSSVTNAGMGLRQGTTSRDTWLMNSARQYRQEMPTLIVLSSFDNILGGLHLHHLIERKHDTSRLIERNRDLNRGHHSHCCIEIGTIARDPNDIACVCSYQVVRYPYIEKRPRSQKQ